MSGGTKNTQLLQQSLRGVVDVDTYTRHLGPGKAMLGETAAESKDSLSYRLEAAVNLSGADREGSMRIFKEYLVFTHRKTMGAEDIDRFLAALTTKKVHQILDQFTEAERRTKKRAAMKQRSKAIGGLRPADKKFDLSSVFFLTKMPGTTVPPVFGAVWNPVFTDAEIKKLKQFLVVTVARSQGDSAARSLMKTMQDAPKIEINPYPSYTDKIEAHAANALYNNFSEMRYDDVIAAYPRLTRTASQANLDATSTTRRRTADNSSSSSSSSSSSGSGSDSSSSSTERGN
jgi:hypothetical protein